MKILTLNEENKKNILENLLKRSPNQYEAQTAVVAEILDNVKQNKDAALFDYTKRFEKDLKRCLKRGLNIQLIQEAIALLAETGTLPAKYRPHKLSGQFDGCWECHIQPDWLMTWKQNDTELTLLFLQTGTHSDLF